MNVTYICLTFGIGGAVYYMIRWTINRLTAKRSYAQVALNETFASHAPSNQDHNT